MDKSSQEAWARFISAHEAFHSRTLEFLNGPFDRIGALRWALENNQRKSAYFMMVRLPEEERLQMLPELVQHASWGHGLVGELRQAIVSLPREAVLAQIDALAERHLAQGTEDEFRRMLELFSMLDPERMVRLAQRAARHEDGEIREAGEDFLARAGRQAR